MSNQKKYRLKAIDVKHDIWCIQKRFLRFFWATCDEQGAGNKSSMKYLMGYLFIVFIMLMVGCQGGTSPETEAENSFIGPVQQVSDGVYTGSYDEVEHINPCAKAVRMTLNVTGHDLLYSTTSMYTCPEVQSSRIEIVNGDTLYFTDPWGGTPAYVDTVIETYSLGSIVVRDDNHLCITVPANTECFYVSDIKEYYFEILIDRRVVTFTRH